jgi:DivIVA domain-containing protein
MSGEEIVRRDFPRVRKGYDPGAVDAHLRAVAERVEKGGAGEAGASLAVTTGQEVAGILAAAEQKAAEIEQDARARAEQIVAEARTEAELQVQVAQQGVAALVSQAAELRQTLGVAAPAGETEPARVPEPTVPQPEIDPSPVVVPEPTPDPVPEPTPTPAPEPAPSPSPEPTPLPQPGGPQEVPPAAQNGTAAAKLVAMKMALEGVSREEIAARLRSEYGLEDAGQMLDDVFARAERLP